MTGGPIRRIGRRPPTARVPGNLFSIGRGSLRHARTRCRIPGRPGHDARPGLPRPTPRGDGRCRGWIARRGAPDAAAQGVAHELADRPAQEGRPLGLLLRRGQGRCSTWPRGRSPGSTGPSTPPAASPGGEGPAPAVRAIPEAVHRFHKEAEAGMRLSHPNIVRIIDVGQQDNRHFMIMEYVEGMNLRDFLRLRARMKGHQALPLMIGLAEGLKYSHRAGRHPPRHQGDQHPDLQLGGRQARRLRPGHHRGGREQAGRQEPAHRRLLGAGAHLQEPQGRPPLGHLLPRLRLLPDGDRPVPHGGVREQGPAQEDARALLRRNQADRRASLRPDGSCARSSRR